MPRMTVTNRRTMLPADFLDAHHRHWNDAQTLFDLRRFANADHLYGFAAECGLKALMVVFGMPTNNGNPRLPEDRKHMDQDLWDRFESYRQGHSSGAAYALPNANPFKDWKTSDRYAHRSHFDQNRVELHRQGAEMVRELVKHAQRTGVLS